MVVTKFKMDFMDALNSDVRMLSHALSSSLAHKISDEMEQEYQYIIEKFYSEYNPEYYVRHSERGMNPGLNKTFKTYYKNPHNTIYYGGIEITSENMYNDYHDSKEKVLGSFLDGYHGAPSVGIRSSLLPYKYMLKVRERLIRDIRSSNRRLLSHAKDEAKSAPYQLIKIL